MQNTLPVPTNDPLEALAHLPERIAAVEVKLGVLAEEMAVRRRDEGRLIEEVAQLRREMPADHEGWLTALEAARQADVKALARLVELLDGEASEATLGKRLDAIVARAETQLERAVSYREQRLSQREASVDAQRRDLQERAERFERRRERRHWERVGVGLASAACVAALLWAALTFAPLWTGLRLTGLNAEGLRDTILCQEEADARGRRIECPIVIGPRTEPAPR